jgi:integrase
LFRCLIGARLAHEATGPSDSRLHQARQTYASFMIASGVNAKALCSYMGHSSIKVTFDLYGYLMPGAEAEAAGLLDAYLAADRARAEDAARLAASKLVEVPAPTG